MGILFILHNPFHLVACFECFVNPLLPHHLRQEGFKAFPALCIHADEMLRQFAGKQQGIVQNGLMLFKISLAHPAILSKRYRLIRDGQNGKKIVAAAMIGQFHTNLLSNTKKQLWT